ncbi:MAG: Hsp20/alpha crystallin family protein [Magnetococcales bacterium]|nr:Hsp20/alpha crystallin family protein [Magnetococcales bacterium]
MNIMHYDPMLRSMRTLNQELSRLFDPLSNSPIDTGGWDVRVDITEEQDRITLQADLPGMDQKEIKVELDNGLLTLSGERHASQEIKDETYRRVERSFGRFSRSFRIPNTADVENISATYRDGVLEIVLPKKEEAKPRAIAVKVH